MLFIYDNTRHLIDKLSCAINLIAKILSGQFDMANILTLLFIFLSVGISSEKDVVISFSPKSRLSIVNKSEFFYRFGKAEAEAIACFDFLNDITCDSDPNDSNDDQCEEQVSRWPSSGSVASKGDNWDDNDNDDLSFDRYSQLSLSDSCVEYYDSSD